MCPSVLGRVVSSGTLERNVDIEVGSHPNARDTVLKECAQAWRLQPGRGLLLRSGRALPSIAVEEHSDPLST